MSDPISFDPYLAWVDTTDPDNLPEGIRLISASDLLRYENFGVTAKTKINAESVRVDDVIVRLDDIDDLTGATNTALAALDTRLDGVETGLDTRLDGIDASILALDGRIDTLEAGGGGGIGAGEVGSTNILKKPSDQVRTNSTTLVNDTTMTLTVGPYGIVEVEVVLFFTSPVAAGFKVAFTGSGVSAGRWGIVDDNTSVGWQNIGGIPLAITSTGSVQMVVLKGYLGAGSGGGSVTLAWAQNAADAGNTTVHNFSYMKSYVVSVGE